MTIALQALIHNSQLYVSNKVPKVIPKIQWNIYLLLIVYLQSGIQGFIDPAPENSMSIAQ